MRIGWFALVSWLIATAAAAQLVGPQSVLILPVSVSPTGTTGPTPWTVAQFEPTLTIVRAAYLQDSYGTASLVTTITPWLQVAYSGTDCGAGTLKYLAKQRAVALGFNPYAYKTRVFVWNNVRAGCAAGSSTGVELYINGVAYFTPRIVDHELGHSRGLGHSDALECGTVPLKATCSTWDQGNPFESMGKTAVGSFSLTKKESLGWLNTGTLPKIQDATGAGTYTFEPANTPTGGGPKGLRIVRKYTPYGSPLDFTLEQRQSVGIDTTALRNSNVPYGVLVYLTDLLLDMTGETQSWLDAALTVGKSWTDAGILMLTVTDLDPVKGATVRVDVLQPPLSCATQTPTTTINTPVTFEATGGDNVYSWNPTRQSAFHQVGATWTKSYPTAGTYTVTVGSGPQLAACRVVVQ